MNNSLKRLNFNDLLVFDKKIKLEDYDFNIYMENNEHPLIGFCTRCDEQGCNVCPSDSEYKLLYMSHGASSEDVIQATRQNIDFSGWHNEGVFFLMEGPSIQTWPAQYKEFTYNGHTKKPSPQWYWIHDWQKASYYPDHFKGFSYGGLFNSIIFTFKLRNAYLTNLVKCGLNNSNNDYKGINLYDHKCITTCFENYLLKELEIVKPKILFCFGSSVDNILWDWYPKAKYPFEVVALPHPAGQRRGFKNEFYRHLYFSMILEGLYKSGIYTLEEAREKYNEFLILAP